MSELRYYQRPDVEFYGRSVHVWKGRNQHRALNSLRTMCGMPWVATNTGPPATETPECKRCRREFDIASPTAASSGIDTA